MADRAWGLMNADMLSEADAVVAMALRLDPNYSTAWLQRGRILRRLGRLTEAVAAFDSALKIDPNYQMVNLNKGLTLADMGRFEEALQLFDQYIAAEPSDAAGWNNHGLVLARQEKRKQAIESFERAVRVDPTFVMAWLNKAGSHLVLAEVELARDCVQRGLELDPLNLGGLLLLGQIELRSKHSESALAAFTRITELSPEYPSGWAFRAVVETDAEAALECCIKAERLDFNDQHWLVAARARALALCKRFAEAAELYDLLLREEPDNEEFMTLKSVCELQLKLYKELDSLAEDME